jgi:hypothetical protein
MMGRLRSIGLIRTRALLGTMLIQAESTIRSSYFIKRKMYEEKCRLVT